MCDYNITMEEFVLIACGIIVIIAIGFVSCWWQERKLRKE